MPASTNRTEQQPAPPKPKDNTDPQKKKDQEEPDIDKHNGSAGAFEATEQGGDEEDDDK